MTFPVIFLSHGSPMLALTNDPTADFLRSISRELPVPKAIVVISAHWESDIPLITGASKLETIHDFYGFPKELYELQYPATGDIGLANEIKELLEQAGIKSEIDATRGLDHGAWNPLFLMYPEAKISVLQISVQPKKDAAWHYKIGQALASLRERNILIIGSGNLTHNLREAFSGNYLQTPKFVTEFADWVADVIEKNDIESLLNWQKLAPNALKNHPTTEHLLPLFVVMGAAGKKLVAKRLNKETILGVLAMDAYYFE